MMKCYICLSMLVLVYSHSWLECTKYTGNLETFEPDQCLGRPRPLDANGRNVGGTFGQDIGMDFRPAASGANPCQGDASLGLAQNYGGAGNVVQYEAGKTYTLAWPPKNHAAAECTNPFIPDNFLKIFAVPYTDQQADPNQSEFRNMPIPSSFESDPHVRGEIDFKGFQNCPRFCDDTDKSLCTGTITIPSDMPLQTYTLQWYWAFNSPTDLYATCWEAQIVANTGGGDQTVTLPPVEAPPCTVCCPSGPIQAPGTGEVITYGNINPGENEEIDCPDGFDGTFKVMCVDEGAAGYIARLVDGQCSVALNNDSGEDEGDSSTVAGLAVALTIVTLLFLFYVLITQGIIDCSGEENQSKKLNTGSSYQEKSTSSGGEKSTRQRVDSVRSASNTELPILPETPFEWYHTTMKKDETKGPIIEKELIDYCKKIGITKALENIMVWNGEDVNEWTMIEDIPRLKRILDSNRKL